MKRIRRPSLLAALAGLTVLFFVGLLAARLDLQPLAAVALPLFIWLIALPDTTVFLRKPWFWWTSAGFVVVSAVTLSALDIAPRGTHVSRWLLIMFAEIVVFVVTVTLVSPIGWPSDNDSNDA
jgi:hypothetical protein